ncbi:MAG: hypothetical protein APF81_17365 [Desulfosporosinus sp. BRH_c37]|nr:MAG: hypothetical protein APF81_17365 [Desulfosporosinus sp. BRH_c37]
MKSSELAQLTTQSKSQEQQVKDYKSKYLAEQEKVTLKQRELEVDSLRKRRVHSGEYYMDRETLKQDAQSRRAIQQIVTS